MDDAMHGNAKSDGLGDGAFGGLHVYAVQLTALNNSGVGGYALLSADEGTRP